MKSLGVAVSFRYQKGKTPTLDYRHYISSRKLDTKVFGQAVRSHWGIENSLHWVLDVSMSEDACQIYRGNAPEILASTRQLGLNMLKSETSKKASIRSKMRLCAMDTHYLDQVWEAGIKAVSNN